MKTYRGIENIEKITGKTVVTLGTFDGVHSAHRTLLERTVSKAREL
jgi:FAD synthase